MSMTSDEVWDLLELIASIDRRKLGLTDRQMWEGLIGDLDFADAQVAVVAHYRESTDWIMPAHVRQRVKAIRRDRLERNPLPAPPAELADRPGRYQRFIQEGVRRIADGMRLPPAIEGKPLEGDPPAEWSEARAALPAPEAQKRDPRELAAEQAAEARADRERRESGKEAS